jgi:hypothetical protein
METIRTLLLAGVMRRFMVGASNLLRTSLMITSFGVVLVVMNNLFDYVFYPTVLCRIGLAWGIISLALISIPFNQILIIGFNWVGKEIVLLGWLWRLIGALLGFIGDATIYMVAQILKGLILIMLLWLSKGWFFGAFLLTISMVQSLISTMVKWWKWINVHVTLLAFVIISAYDPIPAMLFAQQVYRMKVRSIAYGGLFLIATIVANGVWAVGVVLGIEAIQALDQEFFTFISWCEEWVTWTATALGSSWQADFGFLRELLGTCAI